MQFAVEQRERAAAEAGAGVSAGERVDPITGQRVHHPWLSLSEEDLELFFMGASVRAHPREIP